MQNAAKFWDKIAEKYAKSPIADEEAYTCALERTRSYLSPNDAVLEVGCGTGSTALLLAGDVRQITASDLSSNMIRIGSEKARDQGVSNVTFVAAELFDSTIENGPYDAVLALNLLHLLEDLPAAIHRINGLLKPGGTFISKTVCALGSGIPLKYRIMKMILPLMQFIGKAPYVNFMEIKDLEKIISSGGFKIIETGNYPASPPNRYIVARKM
jgi:ubiquinone/menaquinone biosynthesis C-methylase UbiE